MDFVIQLERPGENHVPSCYRNGSLRGCVGGSEPSSEHQRTFPVSATTPAGRCQSSFRNAGFSKRQRGAHQVGSLIKEFLLLQGQAEL